MPRVPVVNLPQISTRAAPLPFENYDTAGAFGGGEGLRAMGAGVASGADQLAAGQKRRQDQDDAAAIAAATGALEEHINQ